MVSFGPGCFDREVVSKKPILISSAIQDVSFVHNGWIRGNTLFRGFTAAGKVKVWLNHHISVSNDEIRMGVRNPRTFSSFDHNDIVKIMLDDQDIRNITLEQFERLVSRHDAARYRD